MQLGKRGRQDCGQCKLFWNYAPTHLPGSPQAKTESVAPLPKDEAKCHGANSIKFCKFMYPPQWDDCIQSALGHGAGASYLPASHAQELLGRMLAGTDKTMKYTKARCSGLAGYISVPPWSLTFARSTLVLQKKNIVQLHALYCMSPLGCMMTRKSIQSKKTILGNCLFFFPPVEFPLYLYFMCLKWLSLLPHHTGREKS